MYWADEQRDVFFVLLPLTYIIGGLGYLTCVHLNSGNQSCPTLDQFYKKNTRASAITITIPEAANEEDWWKCLLLAIVIILAAIDIADNLLILYPMDHWRSREKKKVCDMNDEIECECATKTRIRKDL